MSLRGLFTNAIRCQLAGALAGAMVARVTTLQLLAMAQRFIPGDTVALGAWVGGVRGFFWREQFRKCLREHRLW